MLKIKRLLPLLFSLVLLFCSVLPVQAQTVSSGDALYANEFVSPKMMSLSPVSTLSTEDYGISLTGTEDSNYGFDIPAASLYVSQYPNGSGYFGIAAGESVSGKFVFHQKINDIDISAFYNTIIEMYIDLSAISLNWDINTGDPVSNVQYTVTPFLIANGNIYSGVKNSDCIRFYLPEGIYGTFGVMFEVDYKFTNTNTSPVMLRNLRLDTPFYRIYGYLSEKSDSRYIREELKAVNENMKGWFANVYNRILDTHNAMTSSLSTWFQGVYDYVDLFRRETGEWLGNIYYKLIEHHNAMTANLTSWFTTLFEKMDEDQEELINGYDPGTGSAAKNEFDSSAAELEAAECDLFGQTSYDQVDYTQFNSFFSIEAVAASMLFVKSILESLYGALGVFGVPITIGLVLLVFTRIIGFQNFYSGGD